MTADALAIRATDMLTIDGRTQTLRGWSAETGITMAGLRSRIRNGVTGKKLIAPRQTKRGPNIQYSANSLTIPAGKRQLRIVADSGLCVQTECGALAHHIHPQTERRTAVCTCEKGCFRR